MKRLILILAALAVPDFLHACSLCDGQLKLSPTFRQEAALDSARLILHGVVLNPRLNATGKGGECDFHLKEAVRTAPLLKGVKVIKLPKYLPVSDPKNPPHYLLFCDLDGKKIDPYRGVPIHGAKTVEYLKKALALNKKDPVASLVFFFGYLDNADPEVARDAFLEFARANDADIVKAGKKFDAVKLRKWLKDKDTPAAKISVYAMLLGHCGKSDDAADLRKLLDSKEERFQQAADGIMAGYMQLKSKEGWNLIRTLLSDGRKPLTTRLAILRTLRFQHGAAPKENKDELLKTMKAIMAQGDLADLAVEDLRQWQLWDLTPQVLTLYGKKGFDAPLMKRAILRYALTCKPTKETKTFLDKIRKNDPDEVQDVEDGLKLERQLRKNG